MFLCDIIYLWLTKMNILAMFKKINKKGAVIMIDAAAANNNLVVTLTTADLKELVASAVNEALNGINDFSEKKSPTVVKKYLNKRDICEYLNISLSTLDKWLKREDFPFLRVEGVYRFRTDEVEQWVEEHKER